MLAVLACHRLPSPGSPGLLPSERPAVRCHWHEFRFHSRRDSISVGSRRGFQVVRGYKRKADSSLVWAGSHWLFARRDPPSPAHWQQAVRCRCSTAKNMHCSLRGQPSSETTGVHPLSSLQQQQQQHSALSRSSTPPRALCLRLHIYLVLEARPPCRRPTCSPLAQLAAHRNLAF